MKLHNAAFNAADISFGECPKFKDIGARLFVDGANWQLSNIDADFVLKVYHFLESYKNGEFGIVSLQDAIDSHFNKSEIIDKPSLNIADNSDLSVIESVVEFLGTVYRFRPFISNSASVALVIAEANKDVDVLAKMLDCVIDRCCEFKELLSHCKN